MRNPICRNTWATLLEIFCIFCDFNNL